MFFTHDRAWEEFFCVCIQLLNKTWKEMRATAEDFNKVGSNTHATGSFELLYRQTKKLRDEKCIVIKS